MIVDEERAVLALQYMRSGERTRACLEQGSVAAASHNCGDCPCQDLLIAWGLCETDEDPRWLF